MKNRLQPFFIDRIYNSCYLLDNSWYNKKLGSVLGADGLR